jgi:hypothetical protein
MLGQFIISKQPHFATSRSALSGWRMIQHQTKYTTMTANVSSNASSQSSRGRRRITANRLHQTRTSAGSRATSLSYPNRTALNSIMDTRSSNLHHRRRVLRTSIDQRRLRMLERIEANQGHHHPHDEPYDSFAFFRPITTTVLGVLFMDMWVGEDFLFD